MTWGDFLHTSNCVGLMVNRLGGSRCHDLKLSSQYQSPKRSWYKAKQRTESGKDDQGFGSFQDVERTTGELSMQLMGWVGMSIWLRMDRAITSC